MSAEDHVKAIDELLSAMSPEDVRALAETVAGGALFGDIFDRGPVPSRRRPRRADTVTYRVRIDLREVKPPLWRRLELASDLFLDEVHEAIQAAFGWCDGHLHQFGSGPDYYHPETEYYLCPFQADEGEPGVPEDQVRLDEVLAAPGDILFYCYDFGDDWQHRIELEAVQPRTAETPRAHCTTGRRPAPAEDCGGVIGYEFWSAVNDPQNPAHQEALAEFRKEYSDSFGPEEFAPQPFDIAEINSSLAVLGTGTGERADDSPTASTPATAGIDRRLRSTPRREYRDLVRRAELDRPVLIDDAAARTAVERYLFLLDRVGDDGVKLTSAGYLPPAVVLEIFTGLDMDRSWIGKGNREDLTPPVFDLRESAQRLGLVRKYRGRLTIPKKIHPLRDDPAGLWRYIAGRTLHLPRRDHEHDASVLYLLLVAAGETDTIDRSLTYLLDRLGWTADFEPLTEFAARAAAAPVTSIMAELGLLHPNPGYRLTPAPDAANFARAALSREP